MSAPASALPVATGRATAAAVLRSAGRHRGLLAGSVVSAVVASVSTVLTAVLLGRVVDVVLDTVAGRSSSGALTGLTVALGACVLVGALFAGLALRQAERLGAHVAADLREEVVERSLRMEPAVLERAGAGDVTTRVTEDTELFTLSVPTISAVITSLVTVLVSLGGFVSLDWRLGAAFLAVLPVYAIGLRYYLPKAGPLYATERARSSHRSRVLLESVHGRRTVHAYGMGDLQTGRVEAASADALTAGLKAQRTASVFGLTMNAAEGVGLSAVIGCGFLLVRGDLTTVGDVTAAALLFHRLFGPLGWLLMSIDEIQRAGAALARLVGVIQLPVRPAGPPTTPTSRVSVRVRGVRHSYDGTREVLHGVDVDIPAGSSLAVVGESGAGKTTLAALVAGVSPATAGTIELVVHDGAGARTLAVDDLTPEQVRELVTMVSQETHVFTGTVRDDLHLAVPGADDDRIRAVLARVGAAGWVAALPAGLDTAVGAGGHPLTVAQEQQLALARIALRDSPVVVLDEATAEAGSAGARDLERAAIELIHGRTALVVAHRLTQARACDRIAVMSQGRLVELGDHDSLVAADGLYSRLWAAWAADASRT